MFVIFLSLTSKLELGSFNRALDVMPTFEWKTEGVLRTPTFNKWWLKLFNLLRHCGFRFFGLILRKQICPGIGRIFICP